MADVADGAGTTDGGGPAERRCTRYDRAGVRCTNPTTSVDGWCRRPDCPGYVRPRPDRVDDEPVRAPHGTRRHIAETASVVVPVDVDEVPDVRISRRALESFRYHHEGGDRAAEVQLRQMLEDFLVRSARRIKPSGYVALARDGYELLLSPDAGVVVGYRTVHKERTWEQVKAGIPSRYGRRGRTVRTLRPAAGPRPPAGPALPPDRVAAALDPASVHLTATVRNRYAVLRSLQQATDAELDAALRAELAVRLPGLVPDAPDVAPDPGSGAAPDARPATAVALVDDETTWVVSLDALVLVTVRRRPAADPA